MLTVLRCSWWPIRRGRKREEEYVGKPMKQKWPRKQLSASPGGLLEKLPVSRGGVGSPGVSL